MAPSRRRGDGDTCCSNTFLKCVMLFCAMLTAICGGLFLLLSLYLFVTKNYFVPLLHNEAYMHCIYLMTVCGCLILMSCFLSCSAASSRCANTLYLLLLLIILIAESFLAYWAVQFTTDTLRDVGHNLKVDVSKEYFERADIRWAVDKLQIEGKCCGSLGFTDYPKNATSEEDEDEYGRRRVEPQYIPDSCCRDYKPGCAASDHPSNIYYKGCLRFLEKEIQNNMYFVCTAAFAFLIVQSVAILVSFCVCASWKHRSDSLQIKNREQEMYLFD